MKVSIFGLGYVGAVSLACLARDGHQVVGVDVDESKLAMLRDGITPIVEEGMVDLVRNVAASGRVKVSQDVRAAIHDTQLSLICVGTPSAPNGSQAPGRRSASRQRSGSKDARPAGSPGTSSSDRPRRSGLTMTNMSVFELPPREYCRRYVNCNPR